MVTRRQLMAAAGTAGLLVHARASQGRGGAAPAAEAKAAAETAPAAEAAPAAETVPAAEATAAPAVEPVPLQTVRLAPSSIYHRAVEANRGYLTSLDPDRLLHNFHSSAGLPAKGAVYGGWESRGIAGHTLGHHLSACALMFAQTGDRAMRERVAYLAAELERCQQVHGDGYVGGTTVERNGRVLDGKVVFEEVRRGEIRTGGFDVNGGWVPLYTWHKVHAGLNDARRFAGNAQALQVVLGMADYLGTILEGLDDAQLQRLLAAEHGGLNESYADTYALTGERRWLDLARRIRHRAVLDPLSRQRNVLPGLHANTQIPKVIGLARLHELAPDTAGAETADADTARFFHRTVTGQHSYVIGGHSEREHFREPGVIAGALNDRTCEACNSYNMLKLTRHLYAQTPDARLFDYYERTHLNHIMAHQHPDTGMFAYFMPLASGSARTWSTPEESFWCCVGSGMESHAKHGDSIYWQSGGKRLFVNLFIPSRVDWHDGGLRLELATDYPRGEEVRLTVESAPDQARILALRLPGWCRTPAVQLNGETLEIIAHNGYALVERVWQPADVVKLTLPMTLTMEAAPDEPGTTVFLHGPLVLAADLGPADRPYEAPAPALVETDPAAALTPIPGRPGRYAMKKALPAPLTLEPFFAQYERRTAVYFPRLTREQWRDRETAFQEERRKQALLDGRTVDVIRLGEAASERRHDFRSNHSDVIAWSGRNGRQAWWGEGNYISFSLALTDAPDRAPADTAASAPTESPLALQVLYWGEDVDKTFDVYAEDRHLARETRPGPPVREFIAVEYPLPEALTENRQRITARIETRGSDAPVYECRIVTRSA